MKISVLAVITVCAVIALGTASMAAELTNGNFETWSNLTLADSWTAYMYGNGWATLKDTTNFRGTASQQLTRTNAGESHFAGVRQSVSASPGDAFTVGDAWVYCKADSTKIKATIRAAWDGLPWVAVNLPNSTVAGAQILATAAQSANTWYEFTSKPAGNTTGSSVMFILDVRLVGTVTTTIDITWDDLVVYHAYVPAMPIISAPTGSSLNVNVDPGIYSTNANAQYAITIGGGGYTLGTNWLMADGTVGATAAWQTDALWGDWTVGGLSASTDYTFQVKSRYDGTYTQNTYLGVGGLGSTIPEPGSMIALMSGLVGLVGFGVRRRK